jgi:fructokinase
LLGYQGHTRVVESIPVQPVDTTGAGDAFVGAVLFQLMQKTPQEREALDAAGWRHIVRNGNKAGARTCEYLGAMEAFRHLNRSIFE